MDGSEARRGLQTPLRGMSTPMKTPLRTPLRQTMEQTSSTPITPFDTIEKQKENVQPRARGRSAHALSATFSMQHKERQELLQQQRNEHESAVTSAENAESDDPLEAWCAYVKWCIDNYPSGKSSESGVVPLLERATRTFKGNEQYTNDSRYLRLWILYAQHTDVPRDVFQFLLANEIGTRLAALYEELAVVLEGQGVYDEADATYKMGIARRATPLDRLKRRYNEYQERIMALPESSAGDTPTYAKALAQAMARAGRSVLGTKTGRGESKPTNVLGGHQPLSSAARPNARTMNVYRDENGDEQQSMHTSHWDELESDAQRKKENNDARRSLKPMHAMTPRTQARALEVFCDSDEDQSPERRTPRRDDVFRRSGTSETDKLKKSPFLYYEQQELAKATEAPTPKTEAPTPAAEPSKPTAEPSRARADPKAAKSHRTKPRPAAKPTNERHIAPLAEMYPGADIAACLAEKHRPIRATHELCYEELQALRRAPHVLGRADPFAALDTQQGRWLPEIQARPRPPSPTIVTKAMQVEVNGMFGGDSDSEEDASDESSDASEEDVRPIVRRANDENGGVQPTPQRTPFGTRRTPFGATPQRTPLGAAKAPAAVAAIYQDEDEEEEAPAEFEGARVPFQPLTPITERTERTEFSRYTAGTPRDVSFEERVQANDEQDEEYAPGDVAPEADGAAPEADHVVPKANEAAPEADDAAPEAHGAAPRAGLDAASSPSEPTGGLAAPASTLQLPNPCSPADPEIVATLLNNLRVPVSSRVGYVDLHGEPSTYLADLQRKIKTHARRSVSGMQASSAVCNLSVASMDLAIHQKIGEGGYGAVFLAQDANQSIPLAGDAEARYDEIDLDDVDEIERRELVALKVERPANPWEFYVLDELRERLPASLRASVVGARRYVACGGESMLLLEYGSRGTLLELVNQASAAGVAPPASAGSAGGVEEVLAMFFVIDLLRTIEGLHNAQMLHGDLKIDNCMVRSAPSDGAWPSAYDASNAAWRGQGVMLIDFGRAVDLRCYPPEQTFLADWQPGVQDCVEMREMRPWTYQADYYGLASIAYCLLFGKYMETTSFVGDDGRKTYKIQQPLRRYWQTELWTRFFHLMLNPRHHGELPVTDALASLRAEMEAWLAANSFRAGKNLKGLLKKMEIWALRPN